MNLFRKRHLPNFRAQDLSLVFLVAVTLLLPALQHFALNKSLVWPFPNTLPFEATTDRNDGGKSISTLARTDSSVILSYNIRKGSPFPLAGMKFLVGKTATSGIDLSGYDSIKVWLKSTDPNNTVKIIFKTFNRAYSIENDPVSLKYNEIEYKPTADRYPFSFAVKDLSVPSWWVGQRHISIENIRMDVSNVVELEIPTGSTHKLGKASMELVKVELTGKWIRSDRLYQIILALWVSGAVFLLILRFRSLLGLNKDLQIRSEQLRSMAEHDQLTKALNRMGMRNKLIDLRQLPPEHSLPITIIMMDLDHFKMINDTHGHAIGDEVLIAFAKRVQEKIRSRDLLIRWGGEEFVVFCLNTHLAQGLGLAEKLRLSLSQDPIYPEIAVTVSCGVAVSQTWEFARIIEKADQALYKAKTQGRNQVCHVSD